jgi:hypothetical protein
MSQYIMIVNANYGKRVMETGDHSKKNGASLKSQTSKDNNMEQSVSK